MYQLPSMFIRWFMNIPNVSPVFPYTVKLLHSFAHSTNPLDHMFV